MPKTNPESVQMAKCLQIVTSTVVALQFIEVIDIEDIDVMEARLKRWIYVSDVYKNQNSNGSE